jgi:hypothetical protein
LTTFRLAEHGEWFATRHNARLIREQIETQIAELPDNEPIVLDFDGVEMVTGGFADELAGELWTSYGSRLRIEDGNEDVAEMVALALTRRGSWP